LVGALWDTSKPAILVAVAFRRLALQVTDGI
jgi:hypothetical protein